MTLDSAPVQRDDGFESSEFSYEPPHFSKPRIAEDLLVPWGGVDLLVLVGLVILVSFIVLLVGMFSVQLGILKTTPHDESVFGVAAQVFIDFALMGYLALHVRLRFREPFWETIGWRKFDAGILPRWVAFAGLILAGMFISAMVNAVSDLYPPKGTLPIDSVYQDKLSTLLFLIMAVTIAPVFEETIFRGYIYPVIGKTWGVAAGILITGTLFGLLHGFQLGGALWQIALLVMVGIIFTWVRATSRTVVASYCLHVGYNSFLFIGFLASTHLLKSMPGAH